MCVGRGLSGVVEGRVEEGAWYIGFRRKLEVALKHGGDEGVHGLQQPLPGHGGAEGTEECVEEPRVAAGGSDGDGEADVVSEVGDAVHGSALVAAGLGGCFAVRGDVIGSSVEVRVAAAAADESDERLEAPRVLRGGDGSEGHSPDADLCEARVVARYAWRVEHVPVGVGAVVPFMQAPLRVPVHTGAVKWYFALEGSDGRSDGPRLSRECSRQEEFEVARGGTGPDRRHRPDGRRSVSGRQRLDVGVGRGPELLKLLEDGQQFRQQGFVVCNDGHLHHRRDCRREHLH